MLHIWYHFITTLIDTGEQKAIFIRERGRGSSGNDRNF